MPTIPITEPFFKKELSIKVKLKITAVYIKALNVYNKRGMFSNLVIFVLIAKPINIERIRTTIVNWAKKFSQTKRKVDTGETLFRIFKRSLFNSNIAQPTELRTTEKTIQPK